MSSSAEAQTITDAMVGILPDSGLAALCRQREVSFRHVQGSYEQIVTPADPGNVSLQERAALALRIALIDRDADLAAHYRDLLRAQGGAALIPDIEAFPAGNARPRLSALLRHAGLMVSRPVESGPRDIQALLDVGLSARDVVAVHQLIAFMVFHTRLLAGLRALKQEGLV